MIESLFFDVNTIVAKYTDGTHEKYAVKCSEYEIASGILPFDSQTTILASLVVDLIHRVRELEFINK
jgi:hypothetical protein